MNNEIEQQLKEDSLSIKSLAERRLASLNLEQQVIGALETKQNSPLTKSWHYGLAAAVSLTIFSWLFSQHIMTHPEEINASQLMVENTLQSNLKSLPVTIEQSINQPLMDEQDAIIADLKALKKQILSI